MNFLLIFATLMMKLVRNWIVKVECNVNDKVSQRIVSMLMLIEIDLLMYSEFECN